jgi:hypothetical protein
MVKTVYALDHAANMTGFVLLLAEKTADIQIS